MELLSAVQRVFLSRPCYRRLHLWYPVRYSRLTELETSIEVFEESGVVVDTGGTGTCRYGNSDSHSDGQDVT